MVGTWTWDQENPTNVESCLCPLSVLWSRCFGSFNLSESHFYNMHLKLVKLCMYIVNKQTFGVHVQHFCQGCGVMEKSRECKGLSHWKSLPYLFYPAIFPMPQCSTPAPKCWALQSNPGLDEGVSPKWTCALLTENGRCEMPWVLRRGKILFGDTENNRWNRLSFKESEGHRGS